MANISAVLADEIEDISSAMASIDMAYVLESQAVYDDIMVAFPCQLAKVGIAVISVTGVNTIPQAASKREREDLNNKDANLVYGEIKFEAFGIIIEKIRKIYGRPNIGTSGPSGMLQNRGGIFYDLGSGSGKPIIAAACLYNFDLCCGIELLEGLYSLSLDVLASYNTRGKAHSLLAVREFETHCQMLHGNILETKRKDWRDGDVVFVNSTCFDDKMMAKLANLSVGLKKGAFFVTLTKRLPTTDFVVLEHAMYPMSWGEATIYIMQKITEPKESKADNADSDDEH